MEVVTARLFIPRRIKRALKLWALLVVFCFAMAWFNIPAKAEAVSHPTGATPAIICQSEAALDVLVLDRFGGFSPVEAVLAANLGNTAQICRLTWRYVMLDPPKRWVLLDGRIHEIRTIGEPIAGSSQIELRFIERFALVPAPIYRI